jgi:hypothetical protein
MCAITKILQGAISERYVQILGGNTKKPKYPYLKKAFFPFDKFETHSTIRKCPTFLHSYISAIYIKYLVETLK